MSTHRLKKGLGSCGSINVLDFYSPLYCFSAIQFSNHWQSAYLQEKCRVFLTMASNLLMPHVDNVSVYFQHGPLKAWAYIQHLRNKDKWWIIRNCFKSQKYLVDLDHPELELFTKKDILLSKNISTYFIIILSFGLKGKLST